ncbi:MAG: hypothetical protein K0S44_1472 [Bacteroidetes bacterium]|jgi:hypothetical protein|nr:hypothetical protein [Bacteroidota bacterium]
MIYRIVGLLFIVFCMWCCNHKQNHPTEELTSIQIDSLNRIKCDSLFKGLGKTTFGQIKSIPSDFEGCLKQLDSLTSDGVKEWIKCLPDREFGTRVHHSFGMYLRNNWGLWSNSILSKKLYDMGILHPDDMTAIILDSYQRRIKGEDIRLQEQLKYYQDYWREKGTPVDSILRLIDKKKNGG